MVLLSTVVKTVDDCNDSGLAKALADLRAGKFVVLIGSAERRGEGTLTIAAEHCTADAVAYMANHGRGIISLCLTEERCEVLGLQLMTRENTSAYQAAFTVSIEARDGVTTGISAADRARTIAVAIDPASRPGDIISPGHIFPLRARQGGVHARVAHTEGAVDLAALAGLTPAAVICGILTDDGEMAGPDEVRAITGQLGLTVLPIEELVEYRRKQDGWLEPAGSREVATVRGDFTVTSFAERYTGLTHLAFEKGAQASPSTAFVHEECPAGDIFGASACGCSAALAEALDALNHEGAGVLVYVAHDADAGRLRSVVSPACPLDPATPSTKAAAVARQVLRQLGRHRDGPTQA